MIQIDPTRTPPNIRPEDAEKGFAWEQWIYLGQRLYYDGKTETLRHHWQEPDGEIGKWEAEGKAKKPFKLFAQPGSVWWVLVSRRPGEDMKVRTSGAGEPQYIERDWKDADVVSWAAQDYAAVQAREGAKRAEKENAVNAYRERLLPLREAYKALHTPWQRAALINNIVGYIMGGAR